MEGSDFIAKVGWEGGIAEFLAWGSAGNFPDELVELATVAEAALDTLTEAVERYAKERGLEDELFG